MRGNGLCSAFGLLALTFLCVPVVAQVELNSSKTTCIKGQESPRLIEVVYQNPDNAIPCEVLYTKGGSKSSQGKANNTTGFCEKLERKIVGNLVRGGYECRHEFEGALNDEKLNIELDLFKHSVDNSVSLVDSGGLAGKPGSGTVSSIEAEIAENTNNQHTPRQYRLDEIASELTEELNQALAKVVSNNFLAQLESEFHKRVGEKSNVVFSVDFDVKVSLAASPPQTLVNAKPDPAKGSDREQETYSASANPRKGHSDLDVLASQSRHVILSKALHSESEGHRLVGELRETYPGVKTHLARGDADDSRWHVVLGMGNDAGLLESAIQQLDAEIRQGFSVVSLDSSTEERLTLEFVPDDWQRYAVASCYARGNTTTTEISECSRLLVDTDGFLSCLGGGVCSPDQFNRSVKSEHVDLLAVLGSDDPVAEARIRLLKQVEGCEHLIESDKHAFAECAAGSFLDEEQKALLDCYQKDSSTMGLLDCAGIEEVATYVEQFEQCSVNDRVAAECLLDSIDNDYLSDAAHCVRLEDRAELVKCTLESNLGVEEARVLTCIDSTESSLTRAECIAADHMNQTQRDVLECSRDAQGVADFGLCAATKNGQISQEEALAVQCLVEGNNSGTALLDCAGGRFASAEIQACLEGGISDPGCFNSETSLSRLAHDQLDKIIDVTHLENEITRFRNDLYQLEGGDLPYILANTSTSKIFDSVENVGKQIKKKSGSFLDRLKR